MPATDLRVPRRAASVALAAASLALSACGGEDAAPAGREKGDTGRCEATRKSSSESTTGEEALRQLLYDEVKPAGGVTARLAENSRVQPRLGPKPDVSIFADYRLDVPVTYPGPGTISHVLTDWGSESKAANAFDFWVEHYRRENRMQLREQEGEGSKEYAVLGDDNPGSFFSVYVWRDDARTFTIFGSDEEDSSNVLAFWRCLDY